MSQTACIAEQAGIGIGTGTGISISIDIDIDIAAHTSSVVTARRQALMLLRAIDVACPEGAPCMHAPTAATGVIAATQPALSARSARPIRPHRHAPVQSAVVSDVPKHRGPSMQRLQHCGGHEAEHGPSHNQARKDGQQQPRRTQHVLAEARQ